MSFRPLEGTYEAEALDDMENCIADVRPWMISDKLMLNDDKTECLVIETSKQLSKVSVSSIRVGDVDVISVHSAKNLGSWFDSGMKRPVVVLSFICIISDPYENILLVNVLRN